MKLTMSNEDKDHIYDYLSSNKCRFIYKKTEEDKINSMNLIISEIIENVSFKSMKECFDYLTIHWDKKCKNENCKNERKVGSLFPNRKSFNMVEKRYGIYKFCENPKCNYESISKRQTGDNNTSHRMSEDTFLAMCEKNSKKMKEKIKNGEFIPHITNSWAKSRCDIKFIRNGELVSIKTRSTWDAFFQLKNPNFFYEKVVIPYKIKGVERNYIVDFVDIENRILYEIKPDSTNNTPANVAKYKYARIWCKKNGYNFIIIKNKWFLKNYDADIIIGQPCEDKMLKNLKQFDENKKHKKNRL